MGNVESTFAASSHATTSSSRSGLRRSRRKGWLDSCRCIRVDRVRFVLFVLTGLMSGIAAVCLTSRLGSTRPSIATGMELEVVTMVVLGGVNILGGSGTIPGVVLAAFIIGLVTFGFGLLNVPGIVMSIFLGLLLIGVIAVPRLLRGK